MSLVDIILSRRSIRRYREKDVRREVLDKILEAGRQAPSAANRQPWHFIVVSDIKLKNELSKGLFNRHIKNCAFTIIGCAYIGLWHIGTRRWSVIGTSIALQNMVLAAWAMGVGSCWIGDFREVRVKELLSIPDKWKVVALVSFGYPAEKLKSKRRKALDKIVSFNKF